MKIQIPVSLEEIQLEQMQRLGYPKHPHTTSWEAFFDLVLKLDPKMFFEADMVKAYSIFCDNIKDAPIPEPPKEIKGLGKLIEPIINIKVGHLIEITNAEIDEFTLNGGNILTACFYRENWNAPFSESEIITTANKLYKMPLVYSAMGIYLKQKLFSDLTEFYPILYDSSTSITTEDEGRKSFDLLNGLSKDNPLEWERAKNLPVSTAFAYMEQKKIEAIKNKLNLR